MFHENIRSLNVGVPSLRDRHYVPWICLLTGQSTYLLTVCGPPPFSTIPLAYLQLDFVYHTHSKPILFGPRNESVFRGRLDEVGSQDEVGQQAVNAISMTFVSLSSLVSPRYVGGNSLVVVYSYHFTD